MIKIAMIGAGSVVFSKNLTGDILSFPEFRTASFSYMDVDRERLEVGAALCVKSARALGANPKIEATLDRKAALRDADFVINMMQVGGFDSTLIDFEIPRKYGLNFTIADTTGPGGLFRALRTYPVLKSLCREMEEVCPGAILLNYSNPMSMNMQTISRTSGVRAVGLCHSVQGTLNELAGYLGEKPDEINFVCAGINHMAFYLRLEKDGLDLYPRLFAAMDDPAISGSNAVRFELMKRLGYFVTESSEHSAEYSAYFIPHGPLHTAKFNVPIDEYLRRCDCVVEEFERLKALSRTDAPIEVRRSREYGSTIVHSVAMGKPSVIYGNMINGGTISNLPADAIAEAPTRVDQSGLKHMPVGALPPQLVGYIQPHVTQQELFIRAAMEGRRDHVYQAAMFDPLTAATMPLDKIVEMCDELIVAHGFIDDKGFLPPLDAKKTLVPASGKRFPPVDARELRNEWRKKVADWRRDFIAEWKIAGPFPAGRDNPRGLEFQTRIDEAFASSSEGRIDLPSSEWKATKTDVCGKVDLTAILGQAEWSVAYAYAEFNSPTEKDIILRIGSDDGIKVWVNGTLIHWHEVGRAYRADSDFAAAKASAGLNRIFVKIDNYTGGWAFGVAITGM